MPITALILAAGEGTRMKSNHAKVMHKLLDRPLVWWTAEAARKAGATHIVLIVGHKQEEIRTYFNDINYASKVEKLSFVEQTEQLGTGHAVRCAKEALGGFNGPVIVLYGDTPLVRPETIQSLVHTNMQYHNACTILSMTPQNPAGYGRLIFAGTHVKAIVEDKDCTPKQRESNHVCNSGLYCFCGRRLSDYIDQLTTNNSQHEYYITDMIGIFNHAHEPVMSMHCEDDNEALGVNTREQLAQANAIMQKRINTYWLHEGVSMLDPSQVWIGSEAKLAKDVEILPQTFIYGASTVGEDTTVGPGSRLINAQVGAGCTVGETVIINSSIDDNVTCGPRAYIRGAAHVCESAKVGTHVEIKGSTIGARSKVPHLSYIGDATIGTDTNIGGGSITCNYDGKHKNPTTIGNHVFIGSDTMMVAPVTIGDNALIGASSCITKNVPAGALGLERSKLLVKEQWATQYWETLQKED